MAAGLPVVMTPWVGDYSSMVRSKGTGVLLKLRKPLLNWGALIKMYLFIRKYKNHQATFRKNCQLSVFRELSWTHYNHDFFRIYSMILKNDRL